jgi:hypothetical protein
VKVQDVGQAGLHGWKQRVAETVARRVPVRDDYVRTALGLLFVGLSLKYLAQTARELAARR